MPVAAAVNRRAGRYFAGVAGLVEHAPLFGAGTMRRPRHSRSFDHDQHQRRIVRRRMRLPGRPLSHDEPTTVRQLLSLPLVPARERVGVRGERNDRSGSRECARGEPEKVVTPSTSGAARGSPVARNAGSRSGATTRAPANRSGSFASAASTSRRGCRPTSTSSPRPSSRGSCCPAGVPAVPEYYDSKQYWPAESLERRKALRPRAWPLTQGRRADRFASCLSHEAKLDAAERAEIGAIRACSRQARRAGA